MKLAKLSVFAALLAIPAAAQTYTGSYPLARWHVPLPPGEWTLMGTQEFDSSTREGGTRWQNNRVLLVQERGNQVYMTVSAEAGIASTVIGWVGIHTVCNTPAIERLTVTIESWKQDCGKVTWYRPGEIANPNPHWTRFYEKGKAQPGYMPERFHGVWLRMADNRSYLNVYYQPNPEAFGFQPYRGPDAMSPWDVRTTSEPHRAHMERLKNWLRALHPVVQRAFNDRVPVSAPGF